MSKDALQRLSRLVDEVNRHSAAASRCAGEARAVINALLSGARGAAGRDDVKHNAARQRPVLVRPSVDLATMSVTWSGRTCSLGQTTLFRLIGRLLRYPNTYVSYAQLRNEVWGSVKADETIRSAVRHLKRRLKDAGMNDLAAAIRGENHHYVLLLDPPA
jgi:DNA-binding response OmpR family regulator